MLCVSLEKGDLYGQLYIDKSRFLLLGGRCYRVLIGRTVIVSVDDNTPENSYTKRRKYSKKERGGHKA